MKLFNPPTAANPERELAALPVEAIDEDASAATILTQDDESHVEARRPRLIWLNFALTAAAFRRVRPLAAALMLPTLGWVLFATALNIAIATGQG